MQDRDPVWPPRRSLILVDDHRMFVETLREHLGRSYDIAGVAYRGDELFRLLRTTAADGLILDLQLPDRCGVELVGEVRRLRPQLRMLVVTMFRDRPVAEAALAAGADGFIPKDASLEELSGALAEVLAGRRYLSPLVPKTGHRVALEARHHALQRLTARQQSILCLLGDGDGEGDIARQLGIAASTVTFHKHNIRRTLGIETDCALLGYAALVHECLLEQLTAAGDGRGEGAASEGVAARNSEASPPTR